MLTIKYIDLFYYQQLISETLSPCICKILHFYSLSHRKKMSQADYFTVMLMIFIKVRDVDSVPV